MKPFFTTLLILSLFISSFSGIPFSIKQAEAAGSWYNVSWSYRVALDINPDKVDADLTDFPVYVNLNNLPLDFHTNVNQTDARDIRVTTSDGTTEVPRELVFYTSASDTGELHFKAPSISNTATTTFYIYYGNASATEPAVTDTYGRNNVWSSYLSVYHLNEVANTTSAGYKDATGSRDGTGVSTTLTEVNGALAGKAANFDGSADRIGLGNSAAFQLTSGTFSAWINTASAGAGHRGVVVKGEASGMFLEGDTLSFYDWGSAATRDSNQDPTNSTWRHNAFTFQSGVGSGSKLYLDGSNVLTNTMTVSNQTVEVQIACNTSTPNQHFAGYIDEVRIASSILTATWLSTEYNNQNSSSTFYTDGAQETDTPVTRAITLKRPSNNFLGLAGWWTFDGGTMTSNIGDSSGNARHGYLSGQTSTTTTIGKLGQALSFDGVNDQVNTNVSISSMMSSSAGTMSLWMKPNTTVASNANSFNLPAVIADTAGFSAINIGTVTGQGNKIWLYNWDGNEDRVGVDYTAGEWIHVAWVNDGGTLRSYVNGVASTTVATGSTSNMTGLMRLGRNYQSVFYSGLTDDVRIFNRVLTPTEVKILYLTGQTKVRP